MLAGELVAERKQGPVAACILERGLHLGRRLGGAPQAEGGEIGDERAVGGRARPLRPLAVEAQDRFPIAGGARPLHQSEHALGIAGIGGVQPGERVGM